MGQSIKDGTRCKFNKKNHISEDLFIDKALLEKIENKECNIIRLATYTSFGFQVFEYYDIEFDSGICLNAISGYHLTII